MPLTLNDPVAKEVLIELGQLVLNKEQLALELLSLEQQKVRILSAAHQVDQRESKLFEQILVERGLPPNSAAEIDPKTGILKVLPST